MNTRAFLQRAATKLAGSEGALALAVRAVEPLGPSVVAPLLEPLFLLPPSHPRPATESELLATAHRFRVKHEGKWLAAWSWGDGPTVVGLHGWGGRGGQLASYAAPLVARGYSVVLFDAPGHGESEGRLSSLPEFSRALESVVTAIHGAHAVVAHSMGAAAAALASANGASIGRLVLIGAPTSFQRYAKHFQRTLGLSDRLYAALQGRLESRFGVRWSDMELEPLADSLRTPVLFVHDENDREARIENVERVVQKWPGAELLRTQGLGHYRILRDDRVRDQILAYLTR